MSKFDYDLFTIGAGSGGVRASRLAAQFGARVAIAEEHRVGGTCVIRGCVPKKLLVYASAFGRALDDMRGYGWSAQAAFDWTALIAAKNKEIDRLNAAYISTLNKAGVEMFQTRAVIEGAHRIRLVDLEKTVTAERILIATGGAPIVDRNVLGAELGVTSNEIFYLERFPRRVAIIGGGYIALEFAGIFSGLGADVSIIHRGSRLLRLFDHDVSAAVAAGFDRDGVGLRFETKVERIEGAPDGPKRVFLSDGSMIEADVVLWAVGRAPATSGLGLEAVGVALRGNGAIAVDAQFQSSASQIYAVGDVTDRVQLTPVAIREGQAFAETHFNNSPQTVDYADIPHAVFTQPPVGVVGLTEQEARAAHGAVDIYKTDFRPMKNTMSGSSHRTMMKLIVAQERVVGVHIVGEDAPEMIQCLAIAVKAGLTKRQFDSTIALHPTAAEELVLMRNKIA